MEDKSVNILGVPYRIEYRNRKSDPKLEQCWGCCDNTIHKIIVNTLEEEDDGNIMNISDFRVEIKRILRHELIHAFALESGLGYDSEWATNEEMTDWIARQFPKILEVFRQADAL